MDSSQRIEAAETMLRHLVDETQQVERRVSHRTATTRRMLARPVPPPPADPSTAPTRRDIRPVQVSDEADASGRYSIVHPRRRRTGHEA